MKCVNCQSQIPAGSRYCLNCGAAQPEPTQNQTATDGGVVIDSTEERPTQINWLAREMQLDPTIDYEAQQRYGGIVGGAIGCLATGFFVLIGIVLIIPTVPLLAIFGLPAAIVLGLLTFFNIGRLQERVPNIRFIKRLPGFTSRRPSVLALCVSGYLAAASLISILLMIVNSARHS